MSLSIELRDGFVNLVEAKASKNNVLLKKAHHFSFNPEWVSEDGIVNIEDFSHLLKDQLNKKDIKEKKVTFCINNSSLIYRELTLPFVDERKVPLLVRSEMINSLNLTPEFIMDYVMLEEIETENLHQYRVLAVALNKNYIESILETLKLAGLKAEVIDSAANSIIKFMTNMHDLPENKQVIVADIEENVLRLYLFEKGHYTLTRNNRIEELNRKNKTELVSSIVENINKMVQFTYTRSQDLKLDHIILTGNDVLLSQVKRDVKKNLALSCDIITSNKKIQGLVFENRYINAIGSLIRVSK